MKESYKTIGKTGYGELIEKKSRFLAQATPVSTAEEATACINAIKSKYWDATHNVYAYALFENAAKRYSDDGEPSGTAGVPVLTVIEKPEIWNVVVVVTRYFGGTLLGTGGLVRAYSSCAKLALDDAGIVIRKRCAKIRIRCDYSLWGKIQNFLEREELYQSGVTYDAAVSAEIWVVFEQADAVMKKITDLSDAVAVCDILSCDFRNVDETGKIVNCVKIY